MLIHLMQDMSPYVADVASWSDGLPGWFWQHTSIDWSLLAQKEFNTDVFAATRAFFNNFVKSGQLWAMIIGMIIGYVVRGLTTYG